MRYYSRYSRMPGNCSNCGKAEDAHHEIYGERVLCKHTKELRKHVTQRPCPWWIPRNEKPIKLSPHFFQIPESAPMSASVYDPKTGRARKARSTSLSHAVREPLDLKAEWEKVLEELRKEFPDRVGRLFFVSEYAAREGHIIMTVKDRETRKPVYKWKDPQYGSLPTFYEAVRRYLKRLNPSSKEKEERPSEIIGVKLDCVLCEVSLFKSTTIYRQYWGRREYWECPECNLVYLVDFERQKPVRKIKAPETDYKRDFPRDKRKDPRFPLPNPMKRRFESLDLGGDRD